VSRFGRARLRSSEKFPFDPPSSDADRTELVAVACWTPLVREGD
jgi:hypothetical protein